MEQPRGFLVSVGGAENKGDKKVEGAETELNQFEVGVLSKVLQLVEKEDKDIVVEVVATASSIPDEMYQIYKAAFGKLGCENVGHFKIEKRRDTERKEYLDRLQACDVVMFTGGDQLRLCSVLGGSEFLEMLKDRYKNEHFVIAGTSAGAMAMSNTMIHGGLAANAHLKGEVKMSIGLGFIHNVIIDTHFDKRGRFNRLAQAVATQPGIIGIGLGEDTGIIVGKGNQLTAIGSGSVTIVDGKNIKYNNIADISSGLPISIENIRVHIMSNNDVYDIATRRFVGNEYETEEDD